MECLNDPNPLDIYIRQRVKRFNRPTDKIMILFFSSMNVSYFWFSFLILRNACMRSVAIYYVLETVLAYDNKDCWVMPNSIIWVVLVVHCHL